MINEVGQERRLDDLINWEKKKMEKIEQRKKELDFEAKQMSNHYKARKIPTSNQFKDIN